MKTLEEMIAVMQSALEGKEIQYFNIWDKKWETLDEMIWNWGVHDYRVKPEEPKQEYVPYENADEFFLAQKEHGIYLFSPINGSHYELPFLVDDECIYFYGCIAKPNGIIETIKYTFSEILEKFTWQDGTPCGKLKE